MNGPATAVCLPFSEGAGFAFEQPDLPAVSDGSWLADNAARDASEDVAIVCPQLLTPPRGGRAYPCGAARDLRHAARTRGLSGGAALREGAAAELEWFVACCLRAPLRRRKHGPATHRLTCIGLQTGAVAVASCSQPARKQAASAGSALSTRR